MNINFNITIDERIVKALRSIKRHKIITVAVIILFAGILTISAQTVSQGIIEFTPGERIMAADMNHNFTLLSQAKVPTGTVLPFVGTNVPDGFLFCNGDAYDVSQYPELYAVIGNTYGGGTTSFQVPDLRGVFLRGLDNRPEGLDPQYTRSLGSYQADAFQGHYHRFNEGQRDGGADSNNAARITAGVDREKVFEPITDGVNGEPRTSSETRPKNIAVNYIIKY